MAPVGILIVFASIAGGFAMAGGAFPVLIQPSEFVVIIGAGVGALIAGSPGKMRGRAIGLVKASFKDVTPKKEDYLELFKLLYELFNMARRNGLVSLDAHLIEPSKSDIFRKYPAVGRIHHAQTFLVEAMQQAVNGTGAEELELLMDSELDTLKEEGHLPVSLMTKVSDSLPGIGIVAAVLGIIVTMGHMDAPPAEIGHHVAAALVGTFLGILLSYGVIGPLVGNAELQEAHTLRFLNAIKSGVMASMRGSAPVVAVEFARKVVFTDERPSFSDVDKAIQSLKGSG